MATSHREYVVCGTHSMLYPASSRCPECNGSGQQGVAETPNQRVTIVPTRAKSDGGVD